MSKTYLDVPRSFVSFIPPAIVVIALQDLTPVISHRVLGHKRVTWTFDLIDRLTFVEKKTDDDRLYSNV